MFVQLSMQC